MKTLDMLIDAIKRDDQLSSIYFLGHCHAHEMLGSGFLVLEYVLHMHKLKTIAKDKDEILLHLRMWRDKHEQKTKAWKCKPEEKQVKNNTKLKWEEQTLGDFELVDAKTGAKVGVRVSQGMLGYMVTKSETRTTTPGFPSLKSAQTYGVRLYTLMQAKASK